MKYTHLTLTMALMANSAFAQTPKNVILMISDGCGLEAIRSTNYYQTGKAQGVQAYEQFPVSVFQSTFSVFGSYDPTKAKQDKTYVRNKPTDSAASGTALGTGVKTYDAAIGVGPDSIPLLNSTQIAHRNGKSAGVVTSVQISHATPASQVAHNLSRQNYDQIALEMFTLSQADVIMGTGHPEFDDSANPASTKNFQYVGGESLWNKLKAGKLQSPAGTWSFMDKKSSFDSLAAGLGKTPERIAGIAPVRSSLQQSREGADPADQPFADRLNQNVPALATMAQGALRVLNQNPKGFFLMIEGGAIDWAAHNNQGGRLIEEEMEFNRTVDSVIAWVEKNGGWEQNLLIVTADHETGYLALDAKASAGKGKLPAMSWQSKDHTNQLVPLFAKGAGADQIRKLADQKDPVHGAYTDNAEVGAAIHQLLSKD